jgi:Ca-activated chloride channel homolog
MSDLVFQNIKMAGLFPLVLVLVGLYFYREKNRQRDLDEFTSVHKTLSAIRISRLVLVSLGLVMMIFALMRPAWSKVPKILKKEGRDLVFVLDVSNSMLAEDVIPNRLTRAKIAISEAVDGLADHRVGLVVFAGSASIKCPLTLDYDFFTSMLMQVGPESAAQGGTRIEDALLKTCDKLFSDSRKGYKDIILISDGGDQGKNIDKAVNVLNEQSIKLIGIGIGDEKNGARIPTETGFMMYKGKEVWTKLESQSLQNLVRKCTKGAYLAAGTAQLDLGTIYDQLTRNDSVVEMGEQSVMIYEEKFHGFLIIALVLLILSILPEFKLKTKNSLLALGLCLSLTPLRAQGLLEESLEKSAIASSEEDLKLQELVNQEQTPRVLFGLAELQFKLARFEEAALTYASLLQEEISADLRLKATYNLANSEVKQAQASDELAIGLYVINKSLVNYRKVILQKPHFGDAVINFELAKITRQKIVDDIEAERQKQEEMQQALEVLRQKLAKLIELQTANIETSSKNLTVNTELTAKEEGIYKDTSSLKSDIGAFEKKYLPGIDPDLSPFVESAKSLGKAEISEKQAIEALKLVVKDSIVFQQDALTYLKEALEQFPQDPSQQQNEGESEEDSDSEEGDEEYDEESEEEGDEEYGEPSDTEKVDLENQDIPPPTDTPEDILKREQKIQDIRQKNKSGKKRPRVEKDF